jgi:hypothetical protein
MQITGLTVFTVCFSLVTLSIVARIYQQVKRNQFCINFLLKQWQESRAERLREAAEKCRQ